MHYSQEQNITSEIDSDMFILNGCFGEYKKKRLKKRKTNKEEENKEKIRK